MKNDLRKKNILKRKNFMPALIATLFLWLILVLIIYFLNPNSIFVLPIFFFVFFLSNLFTFSLILANKRRGFLISICLTLFAIFRLFGIGNILNAILIAGLGIIIEIYAYFKN